MFWNRAGDLEHFRVCMICNRMRSERRRRRRRSCSKRRERSAAATSVATAAWCSMHACVRGARNTHARTNAHTHTHTHAYTYAHAHAHARRHTVRHTNEPEQGASSEEKEGLLADASGEESPARASTRLFAAVARRQISTRPSSPPLKETDTLKQTLSNNDCSFFAHTRLKRRVYSQN